MSNPDLSIYCGHYFSEESLLARQIIIVDDILFYQRNAESKTELISTGENKFQIKESELFLQFNLSGQTKTMTMQEKDKPDTVLTQYFPEIFDPVKLIVRTMEKVYGSIYSDPSRCLGILNAFSEMRQKRMKHPLEHSDQSALTFIPLKDNKADLTKSGLYVTDIAVLPLPESEEDIAFASIVELSGWIKSGLLSCERLTRIYLDRLKKYGDTLMCVITLTEEHALVQAKLADLEISQGKYRGFLHGIPYGLKDIVDTAGIPTTWGLECNKNRIPTEDAAIVKLFNEAGAILVAKLSLYALSGDTPSFPGDTRNPWDLTESSSGSSSGSAAAVSAGQVAFSIGSEVEGSLSTPCLICGVTGLRASFGRISQSGVYAVGSIDKMGAICRSVADTAIVLSAIAKHNPDDVYSPDVPFYFNPAEKLDKLKIGLNRKWFGWFDDHPCNLPEIIKSKFEIVEFTDADYGIDTDFEMDNIIHIRGWEYGRSINDLLYQNIDKLSENDLNQTKFINPARMVSALECYHTQQLRLKTMKKIRKLFEDVDLIILPPAEYPSTSIFNSTGHPALTIPVERITEIEDGKSYAYNSAITLIGRMYDEGTLCRAGMELEKLFNFKERPTAYKQETV